MFFLLIFWSVFYSINHNSFLGRFLCLNWCFFSFSWALLTLFALNWFSKSTHHIIEGTSMSDFFIGRAFWTFLFSSFSCWCSGRSDSIYLFYLHFYWLSFCRRLFINKSIINMIKIFRAHAFSILTTSHIFRIWNFRWCLIGFDFDSIDMHYVSAFFIFWLWLILFFVSTRTFSFLLDGLSDFLLTHFSLRITFLKELSWLWIINTFDFFNLWSNWLDYFLYGLTLCISQMFQWGLFRLKGSGDHFNFRFLNGLSLSVFHFNFDFFKYTHFSDLISLRAVWKLLLSLSFMS